MTSTSLAVVVAGAVDAPTGGSIYNRSIAERLARQGWHVVVHELDASFPTPHGAALRHASDVLAGIPAGTTVLVDGLAYGAMPDVVAQASRRLRLVPIVHLPLAATPGLDAAAVAGLQVSEGRALACASLVVVTGQSTVSLMARHNLSHRRTVVVEPGTDAAPLAPGSGSSDVEMLSVATVNAGKGHQVLVDALATLPRAGWRLSCVGSLTRDSAAVDAVRAAIARHGLGERVRLIGALNRDEVAGWYARADLFVQASLRETYGMALAEALARGLPVVSTATGAAETLVGARAGILVAPGDSTALATALSRLIFEPAVRGRCAAGARRVRQTLPAWEDAASRLSAVLREG